MATHMGTNTQSFPSARLYSSSSNAQELPLHLPNPNSNASVNISQIRPTKMACVDEEGGHLLVTP